MSPVLKLEGREQEGDWIGVMGSKENHMANLLCENDNKIISNYLMFFSKNAYELMKEVFFSFGIISVDWLGEKLEKNLIASRQMAQNRVYCCQL